LLKRGAAGGGDGDSGGMGLGGGTGPELRGGIISIVRFLLYRTRVICTAYL
jgi:hypothetical protein